MKLFIVTLLVIAATIVALKAWRRSDERKLERVWRQLESTCSSIPETFDPVLIESLPPPAQRYFLYAIRPGTRIRTVARIDMYGEISLGSKDSPNYLPMPAR